MFLFSGITRELRLSRRARYDIAEHRYRARLVDYSMMFYPRFIFLVGALACSAAVARAAEWEATVDPLVRGTSAITRPVTVKYGFGWNGITAATGRVRFTKPDEKRLQFAIDGGTIGLARTLWRYDVDHTAFVDAESFRPLETHEVEQVRTKHVKTDLTFTPDGVTSVREQRNKGEVKSDTRRFDFPNVLSVNAALLYLRAKPLTQGAVHRVVVYPANSAYLCTITVVGREPVTVPIGTSNALKLDVQLNKIGANRELLPHKKVKKTTVWVSDDANRLVLRIEAQVFIGTVFAELQSIEEVAAPQ